MEIANSGHPFGISGTGEVSIVPPNGGGVANAIHHAVDVKVDSLPLNSGVLQGAMEK